MSRVDEFISAAERSNTRRSYASAVQHFEIEWKGFLPATSDSVARYLADYAASLSSNTLRQRLAALSRWHTDQGFTDPTKAPVVRKVLKGIRAVHPAMEKRARPLELEQLQQVDTWLERAIVEARRRDDQPNLLKHTRDRALILFGFWRGFRSDELSRLKLENIQISPGEGLTCYLERSKTDRNYVGREFKCPALSRLCPVTALTEWINAANLQTGPVFRKIDRWGHVGEQGLVSTSLIPILRSLFTAAGMVDAQAYSSHSLRRGFAGWARASGWDLKDLMAYVGWRDIKSAMRYLDASGTDLQARFEKGLDAVPEAIATVSHVLDIPAPEVSVATQTATITVTMSLARFNKQSRNLARGHRLIEQICFERYAMQRQDAEGTCYGLTVPFESREQLDEDLYALLDEMYRIADDNQCLLEVSFHEPLTSSYWD
jgi:integrase